MSLDIQFQLLKKSKIPDLDLTSRSGRKIGNLPSKVRLSKIPMEIRLFPCSSSSFKLSSSVEIEASNHGVVTVSNDLFKEVLGK